ncbi:PTS sugar transporter subunit IIC [Culicoidibacter larvae]|uniref:Permease IIC component n=1 Tax=Culicoidibacter larvae TaxID=2579976 RepID=A0A5R8QIC8_9FIRM|nr:PTS sugar transporter subunit IIC [Culicoidibacter larvae]TLG77476.1 PTS sugar transporter subunit IIC [Culicoidibacter larvae]
MKKFFDLMERVLMPIAAKIGGQRHMAAIRDAFSTLMAPLIIGSLAVLVNTFPVPGFQEFMTATFGEVWMLPGVLIQNMTMGILGLLVALSLGYHLGRSYKLDGFTSSFMAAITFLILSAMTEDRSAILFNWIGAKGLFLAMISSILAIEVFRFIVSRGWTIKMPEGVPPAVSKGFIALVPAIVIFTAAGLIAAVAFSLTGGLSVAELMYKTLQAPFQEMSNSLISVCLLMFARGFLWFFGIHGTNVLSGLTNSMLLPNMEANIAAFAAGNPIPNIATTSFTDAFVSMGGTGVGLALIIAILIASKNKASRDLAIGSTPGGLFNINEPIMYGMPVVLNPMLLIPFLLTPVLCVIIAWIATEIGLVPRTVAMIPWNMPIIIGGFLATGGSISGAILQVVNIAVSVLVYIPFVKLNDRVAVKEMADAEAKTEAENAAVENTVQANAE